MRRSQIWGLLAAPPSDFSPNPGFFKLHPASSFGSPPLSGSGLALVAFHDTPASHLRAVGPRLTWRGDVQLPPPSSHSKARAQVKRAPAQGEETSWRSCRSRWRTCRSPRRRRLRALASVSMSQPPILMIGRVVLIAYCCPLTTARLRQNLRWGTGIGGHFLVVF